MSKSDISKTSSKKDKDPERKKSKKRKTEEDGAVAQDGSFEAADDFVPLGGDAKKSKKERKEKEKKEKKEKEKKEKKEKKAEKASKQADALEVELAEDASESKKSKKSKKRKHDETEDASESKKSKKSKKRTHDETEDDPDVSNEEGAPANTDTTTNGDGEDKKDKKKKRKKNKDDTKDESDAATQDAESQPAQGEGKGVDDVQEKERELAWDKTRQKFICFIGNLPFTADKISVTNHFEKIHPASVRCPTDPHTKKAKGFAFLEFDRFDHMKTCLKLYHHSMFEDGKSNPRKINVELTAGGGGSKSDARKEKLRVKNERLTEQRKRRNEQEEKEKKRKHQKGEKAKDAGKGANAEPVSKAPPQLDGAADAAPDHLEGIHPSRLARLK